MSSSVTRPRAALVALAILLGMLIPNGFLANPASAAIVPSTELITNGSFETGGFTDWETKDMVDPLAPLAVLADDSVLPDFTIVATDGSFAVGHGFAGSSPDTIEFWQEIAIPSGHSANLSFDWRAAWDHSAGSAARTFDVVVEPFGGGTALETANIYATTPDPDLATSDDTLSQTSSVDLSDYAGSTVRVKFVASIPEFDTGSGSMQVDNVSVAAVDIEAPVITLVGADPQIIEVFSEYTELGATVTDNLDTGLTATIEGVVDTELLGEYTVT